VCLAGISGYGLNQKRRTKKRLPERPRQPLGVPAAINYIWSFDFMSDALYSGRRFRVLNIINEGTREVLGIVVDTSLRAACVVRELEPIKSVQSVPAHIRLGKVPEMLAQVFTDWCGEKAIGLVYIQPGKPNQNAYIERFNHSYRTEVLNPYLSINLRQIRELRAAWLITYNEERPHASLGRILPAEFRRQITGEVSTFKLSA
jgi:putative transposase